MAAAPRTDGDEAGFSAAERTAMRERASEKRTQAKRARGAEKAAADLADVMAKIAGMPDGDRELAERVHALVTTTAPDLAPRTYYGQPGYARAGKVVCFFRSGQQDGQRYSTFGVSPAAPLDEADGVWPTSYALTEPTEEAWERLGEVVARAAAEPAVE